MKAILRIGVFRVGGPISGRGRVPNTHTLFDGRGQVANCNTIVASLQPGDEVFFSNGKSFRITGALGNGETTMVLAIEGGGALAISSVRKASEFIRSICEGRLLLILATVDR